MAGADGEFEVKLAWIAVIILVVVMAEKDPCWQWKNDSGEWIDPDAVIYWKGLEE